jgi:hypothetical protein
VSATRQIFDRSPNFESISLRTKLGWLGGAAWALSRHAVPLQHNRRPHGKIVSGIAWNRLPDNRRLDPVSLVRRLSFAQDDYLTNVFILTWKRAASEEEGSAAFFVLARRSADARCNEIIKH